MNQEKIGKFISSLRKDKNMTQVELAKKIGVTDRAVGNWENGRRLPDYSLLKSLCKELNISVNELLNGERISDKDIKIKSEENIINTISYSDKKIKKTKYIYRIILGIIISLIIIFSTLFIIDCKRMNNSEEVFFSDWGFDYYPTINMDEEMIESAIKDYFVKEFDKTKKHPNEKNFVAMKNYLINKKDNNIIVYSWILMESYYLDKGEIKEGSASSIPYKITLNDNFEVIKYEIPRDGGDYSKDMKKLFPYKVYKQMDRIYRDGIVKKLEFNIKEQVKLYFHK